MPHPSAHCQRGCYHLYRYYDARVCRWCAGVARRKPSRSLRAERLRRSIGFDPYPSAIPAAPPWSRKRWYETAMEIARLERLAIDDFEVDVAEFEQLTRRAGLLRKQGSPPR